MATNELKIAREDIAKLLDKQLGDDPLWRAIRSIDRALEVMDRDARPSTATERAWTVHRDAPKVPLRMVPTYTTLAKRVINEKGRPTTTAELMEYVGRHRRLDQDAEKAKIDVTSTLSKDAGFVSVPWENGRGWWIAGRPVPESGPPADLLVGGQS